MKLYSTLCAVLCAFAAITSTSLSAHADFKEDAQVLVAFFTTPFSGSNGGRAPIPSYPDQLTPELRKMIDDIIDNHRTVSDGRLMALVQKRLAEREAERRAAAEYVRICQQALLTPKQCAQAFIDITRPAPPRR
jgi:hypothetical protein